MNRLPLVLLHVVVLALSVSSLSQNAPASDPQALAFAAQSMTAMLGGSSVSDIALTGNATWIAGSDTETGQATLVARGIHESRVDLNLSGGSRTVVRNDTGAFPSGASARGGEPLTASALHNCWISPSWFFPALSLLSLPSDPSLVVSYVGRENRRGVRVQHLRLYRHITGQTPETVSLIRKVSTTDFYLDAATFLPVAMTFNAHPETDANTNIAIEIDFSNYHPVNGAQVPFHIRKLISGGLALDIVLQSAVVNSGPADGLFAIE
jgi:hypothetical protein